MSKIYIVHVHEASEGSGDFRAFTSLKDAEAAQEELQESFTVSCDRASINEVDIE